MNQAIKARWVAALRGGEYQQTKSSLRDNRGHCCLGVLCDLYSKEYNVPWESDWTFLGEASVLPREVIEWAALCYQNPTLSEEPLTYVNDGRGAIPPKSFLEIADLIERDL